jgi:hypothetical protein
MTKAALTDYIVAGLHGSQNAVVATVARVATGGLRKQRVTAFAARLGRIVAGRARHLQVAHVATMAKTQGHPLRRENRETRARFARQRAWRSQCQGRCRTVHVVPDVCPRQRR